MCSICSCQLNIWHAGHSLAPILKLIFTSRVNTEACFSWLTDCPGLTLPSGAVHLKILNLQITLIEWRCQYEESNWDWWIARTAITCPKNLRLPNFAISIVRPSSILGDWENESISSNQFKVMSSWKLGDAKKLSLIERGAKNENFKILLFSV